MKNHSTRNPALRRAWLVAWLAGGALVLGACGERTAGSGDTAGEKLDAAVERTEQAAKETAARAEGAGQSAREAAKEGAADVTAAAKEAGAAVSATMDDVSITAAVSAGLAKDPDLSAVRIDVDTKGGAVTLNGPAPSAEAKARAEDIAKGVQGVVSVDNKLEVKTM